MNAEEFFKGLAEKDKLAGSVYQSWQISDIFPFLQPCWYICLVRARWLSEFASAIGRSFAFF